MSPSEPAMDLASFALEGSLLLLLSFAVAAALRRTSASTRHLLWATTLAGLLLLPAAGLFLPSWQVPLPAVVKVATAGISGQPRAVPDHPPLRTDSGGARSQLLEGAIGDSAAPVSGPEESSAGDTIWFSLVRNLTIAYGAGVLLVLLWLGVGLLRAWRITRSAHPLENDPHWQPLLGQLPAGLGRARLLASPELRLPMTWGFFRPVILFPTEASSWPREERRQALIHELSHVQRHDWLTQILSRLVCAFHWFQPLAWLAARRLGLEAERAADDTVLLAGAKATAYAEQLVSLVPQLRRAYSPAPATVLMARRSQLSVRIHAILDPNCRRYPMSMTFRTLLASLLVIPTLVFATTEFSTANAEPAVSAADNLLFQAVESGDPELVLALIDAGADVNAEIPGDGSPLIQAAAHGDLSLTQLLIERGADVNQGVEGDGNPLIAAARNGQTEILELLIQAGATVDLVVESDENALIQASANGQLPAVKLLVGAGADVNARVIANGSELRTPLKQARRSGHTEVVEYLTASGATD